MKEIIGRLLITQKGYSPTSFTFLDDIVIEAQVENKGKYVTVYKQPADKLLRDLNWIKQFADENRVDEISKDWRR